MDKGIDLRGAAQARATRETRTIILANILQEDLVMSEKIWE